MSRPSRMMLGAALALLLAAPALAAGASYEAELDPTPFDATNRADVIESIGNLTATLDGSILTVRGTFSNFTSPATGGSFRIGLAKGVPGDAIGSLTVEHARQGSFSGTIKLNAAQMAAHVDCGARGSLRAASVFHLLGGLPEEEIGTDRRAKYRDHGQQGLVRMVDAGPHHGEQHLRPIDVQGERNCHVGQQAQCEPFQPADVGGVGQEDL